MHTVKGLIMDAPPRQSCRACTCRSRSHIGIQACLDCKPGVEGAGHSGVHISEPRLQQGCVPCPQPRSVRLRLGPVQLHPASHTVRDKHMLGLLAATLPMQSPSSPSYSVHDCMAEPQHVQTSFFTPIVLTDSRGQVFLQAWWSACYLGPLKAQACC